MNLTLDRAFMGTLAELMFSLFVKYDGNNFKALLYMIICIRSSIKTALGFALGLVFQKCSNVFPHKNGYLEGI